MRAAAVQLNSTADRDRNLESADRLTRAAAAAGADLVVLPEKWAVLATPEQTAALHSPENAGSQRLLRIAERGDRFDTALWTKAGKAAGGRGNSNALVGTPEQVAAALLDYIDLGVDIISARGYDYVDDTIDFGRYVIPLVRAEVAKRDAAAAEKGASRDAA